MPVAPAFPARGSTIRTSVGEVLGCRIFGHRYRFRADGPTMRWECQRGCGAGDSKLYPSAAEARHYAAAFDRQDLDDLGRRAPIFGMFPLRIWHKMHERSRPR